MVNHWRLIFLNINSIDPLYFNDATVVPYSFHHGAIFIFKYAISVLQIILPHSLVDSAVSKFVYAVALLRPIFPVPFIASALSENLDALAL